MTAITGTPVWSSRVAVHRWTTSPASTMGSCRSARHLRHSASRSGYGESFRRDIRGIAPCRSRR